MRSKIHSRQYVNWQELVRDFELICSNAMKYNQKRSRVHKQVRVLLLPEYDSWAGSCAGHGHVASKALRCVAAVRNVWGSWAAGTLAGIDRSMHVQAASCLQSSNPARPLDPAAVAPVEQALIMLRAGKKLLVELELDGRRAVAAMLAAGGAAAAPGSVQLTPADSQAVPSSLFRSGARAQRGGGCAQL